jgi:hypothetical protein
VKAFSILLKKYFMKSKLLYKRSTKWRRKFPFLTRSVEKLPLMILELIFPVIVVLAIRLSCFFQRCTHDLPEVPVYVLVYRSGRDPALSQLPPHSEPSPHDAFARCTSLPGLRLVGVLDSALLALRRMATPHADAVCHSHGIFAVPGLRK